MVFENGVKNIQAAAYNGALTVYQLDSNPHGPTLYFRALVKTNLYSLDSMNPWKKGPVDMIDSTCQTHDNCYGEVQNHPVIK